MSDITRHIGSRIRLYRKLLGLTIDDLAEGIHKSKSTVSKYETGSVSVDAETLFDIAAVLRVSVSKLVDYHSPEKTHPAFRLLPMVFLTARADITCTIWAVEAAFCDPSFSFISLYLMTMIFLLNFITMLRITIICSAVVFITAEASHFRIFIPT